MIPVFDVQFSIGGLLSGIGSIIPGVSSLVSAFRGQPKQRGGGVRRVALRPGASVGPGAGVQKVLAARTIQTGIVGLLSIKELLDLARENTGRPANAQKIIDSIRVCGIERTAEAFGLTETQVCTIAVSRRRRRARGISAADMRRTRSTIRKVHNISHDLQALRPRVRRHHK